MTTRLALRTALQRRLDDTLAVPLWTDAQLNDLLEAALARYGSRHPAEASLTAVVAAGATSLAVGSGITGQRIVRILDPKGNLVPRGRSWEPATGAVRQAWRWWNQSLWLAIPAAGGNWTIDHLANRVMPADDVSTVPVEAGEEEIVIAIALAEALRTRAIEDAKRGLGDGGGRVGSVAALAEAAGERAERLLETRWRGVRVRTVSLG